MGTWAGEEHLATGTLPANPVTRPYFAANNVDVEVRRFLRVASDATQ